MTQKMNHNISDIDETVLSMCRKLKELTLNGKLTWSEVTTLSSKNPDKVKNYGNVTISEYNLFSSWIDGIEVKISLKLLNEEEAVRSTSLEQFLTKTEVPEKKVKKKGGSK